jgi:hypothetical protein
MFDVVTHICHSYLPLLSTTGMPFTWYSFPKAVEGTKWQIKVLSKSVRAYCIIDEIATKLAPACKVSWLQAHESDYTNTGYCLVAQILATVLSHEY